MTDVQMAFVYMLFGIVSSVLGFLMVWKRKPIYTTLRAAWTYVWAQLISWQIGNRTDDRK